MDTNVVSLFVSSSVDSRLVFPRFWLGLRSAVILAVLTFKIVQFRGDSLTTNRREWTRMLCLYSCELVVGVWVQCRTDTASLSEVSVSSTMRVLPAMRTIRAAIA